MKFTDAQQAAIDIRDKTLLVSAAAGSGKTFTLTQRILKSIIEDERDISRMLIVTFTRAAAAELKAKISKTLSAAIAEHPDDDHLQKQLVKLGSANICTIDSFFTTPVRTNFEKLGLPASVRLADDAELDQLRRESMKQAIESFLSGDDSDKAKALSELMSIISPARDNSNVIPTFIDTYQRLSTAPEGIERLKSHADRMKESANNDFFDTVEGGIIYDEILSRVSYAKNTFEKCLADFEKLTLVGSYYSSCFANDKAKCEDLLAKIKERKYSTAREVFAGFSVGRITSVPANVKDESFEYYQKLRTKVNKVLKEIPEHYLSDTPEEISACFIKASELCLTAYSLLADFERRYSEEKIKKGFCEFADMPKFMLRLLTNPDGSPSEYCMSLRECFDEVYIDEYQDVNEIQDKIFALIGDRHRFMVGDIKQSIYGFREAEPSIFANYRNKFKLHNKDDESSISAPENTIFMSDNFRCDENVIKFTNTVCSRVFSAFADSIGYTPNDDLVFSKGKPYPEYQSPAVEISIVTPEDESIYENAVDEAIDEQETNLSDKKKEDEKKLSDEACVTANEILRLLQCEKKADGTPIREGDIAVLVRSHNHAKPLMLALDILGIKYTSSSGNNFSDPYMLLLTDLLTVINNPRSDIPLCRLLTTATDTSESILAFEDMVDIRQNAPENYSLYDAMISFVEVGEDSELASKCREFISEVDRLRRLSNRVSADKLLRTLSSVERYSYLVETDAYVYLLDCACQYVKRTWNGLGNFLTYLNRLSTLGTSSSEHSSSDKSAVSIMTMHQSKGLEFCACFLFGLGKSINLADSRNPMIYSKELGLSFKLPPQSPDGDVFERIRTRYVTNPLWKAADIVIRNKQIEEEARILYVALTRARERLYLSASTRKAYNDLLTDALNCADLPYSIRKSKSYFETIMLALSKAEWNDDIFKARIYHKGYVDLASSSFFIKPTSTSASKESSDELELARLLEEGSQYDEKEKLLASLPSKVAASKVSPSMLDDSVFLPIPTGLLFSEGNEDTRDISRDSIESIRNRIMLMRSHNVNFDSLLEVNKKPTASEKGTATHLFLQFCNYKNVDENGLDAEIERLRTERFISDRTAKIIDRRQLEGFFKSELYSSIRTAAKVHREFRFRIFRPASDFTKNEELKSLIEDKKIFVQGSIDLIIEDMHGNLTLCDYKTDKVSAEEKVDRDLLLKNLKEKHGEQLLQYEYAIKRIFNQTPKNKYIYLTSLGEAIEIS